MTNEYVGLMEKLTALRKLRAMLIKEMNADLKDLNSRDYLVLYKICKEKNEPTMSNISDSTGLSNALITNSVDNLEKIGLVQRVRGNDRRSYIIEVTVKGLEKFKEMELIKRKSLASYFDRMSKDDLAKLDDALRKLSDLVEKYA